ncbi:MAG TPA: hypothetical protein VKY26_12800 [Actinomycetota bacterium]|nr:hypothetical protein [Actinomycetota bacterium]
MAVLGLFLLLAAAGLSLDVVFQNTSSISVDALGQTVTLSSGWLFVAGVATGAIGLIGVGMVMGGLARARSRRAALAESSSTMQDLRTDRDRLAAQLDHERDDRTSTTPAPRQDHAPAAAVNEIDLASEARRAESTPSEYAAVPDAEGREPDAADEHEPVASGRHGIFRRRDH